MAAFRMSMTADADYTGKNGGEWVKYVLGEFEYGNEK